MSTSKSTVSFFASSFSRFVSRNVRGELPEQGERGELPELGELPVRDERLDEHF